MGSSKAIRFQVNGLPFIQTFRIIVNAVLEASVAPTCVSKAEAEATGLFQWRLLIFGHFHVRFYYANTVLFIVQYYFI